MMLDPIWLIVIITAVVGVLVLVNLRFAGKLGLFNKLRARKKEIAITLVWSGLIAVLVMKSYWFVYVNNPAILRAGIMYTDVNDWIPRLGILDFLLIFFASVVAGVLVLNLERLLYAIIASILLSFIFSVIYGVLFIWFALGMGATFDLWGGWALWGQYVTYFAIKNVFRMTFPVVPLLVFLGSFIGTYVRTAIKPSAEA